MVKPSRVSRVTKGGVLDDLEFSPNEVLHLKVKVDIWRALLAYTEAQGFGTEYLVRVLKVHQPDVSNLLNGKIGRFSVGRLIQFAARLNLKAEVKIIAAEPKALPNVGEESKRNGTNRMTSRQIDRVIKEYRVKRNRVSSAAVGE